MKNPLVYVAHPLDPLFHPESVAIIGASTTLGKVGYTLLENTIDGGYKGKIFPINPNAEKILGLKCYKNVKEIAGDVELAIFSIPAKYVPTVAEKCGEKGVKFILVITAGFKEVGSEGAKLEREVVEICKKYGMQMVGPNILGIVECFLLNN